jgi:hypothetical protein
MHVCLFIFEVKKKPERSYIKCIRLFWREKIYYIRKKKNKFYHNENDWKTNEIYIEQIYRICNTAVKEST